MSSTAIITFNNTGLRPAIAPSDARIEDVRIVASVTYAAGTILGEQVGNNGFQSVSITGVPTGGTFTLTYGGQTTAGIPYNAEADAVRTALEALSSLGVGYVRCSGGPLPNYPVVVEFIGPVGNTNVATMTTSGASLTGGSSPASAVTALLAGSAGTAGTFAQTSKAKVAAPTAAPSLAASGSDGSLGTGAYKVAYSYVNSTGETPISPAGSVTPAATNHIAVTTVTPPAGCWVRWYMTDSAGSEYRWFADNNGTGFNILLNPPVEGKKPVQGGVNTCLSVQDGSQVARKILQFAVATDGSNNITFGGSNTGGEFGQTSTACPAYYCGAFNTSDLVGLLPEMLPDFGARIIRGTIANGGVIQIP